MVVDTSAICAIFFSEPESEVFLNAIVTAPASYFSAVSLIEASLLLGATRAFSPKLLDRFLRQVGIEVLPATGEIACIAADAYQRFGKGRHPAGLNFGDVFSYATAKFLNSPLLYKGNDFSKTDVPAAISLR